MQLLKKLSASIRNWQRKKREYRFGKDE
jgi:hypothetical protein